MSRSPSRSRVDHRDSAWVVGRTMNLVGTGGRNRGATRLFVASSLLTPIPRKGLQLAVVVPGGLAPFDWDEYATTRPQQAESKPEMRRAGKRQLREKPGLARLD